jgi:hypothetical protein
MFNRLLVSVAAALFSMSAVPNADASQSKEQITLANKAPKKKPKQEVKKPPPPPKCNTCACVVITGPLKCTDTPTGPRIAP